MANSKQQLKYLLNKMVLYVPKAKVSFAFHKSVVSLLGGITLINSEGDWAEGATVCTETVTQYHMLYTTQQALALNELVRAEIKRLLDSGEEAVLLETSGAYGVLYSKLGD